jgi:hypothetical protein
MAFMISRIGQHRGPIRLAQRWQKKCKDLLPFGSVRSIAQIVSTTFTLADELTSETSRINICTFIYLTE